MPDQNQPSTPGRRRLLQGLVAATLASGPVAGRVGTRNTAQTSSDADTYTVVQGDDRYEVTPLSGDDPVEALYDLRIPEKFGGDNGATDPGSGPYYGSVGTRSLQRESTTLTFLYDGPNGTSLVVVHDAPGGDGGSASWTVGGRLDHMRWLVKDDYYTDPQTGEKADSNYDNWKTSGPTHEIDWTWGASRGDGGVLGYLGDDPKLTIDPRFNEQATLWEQYYSGTIDDWQFLSGSVDSPERISLALDEPVAIGETQPSTERDRSVDLSFDVTPGQVNARSRGVIPVVVEGSDAGAIVLDSLRFGTAEALADGGGVRPAHGGHRTGQGLVLHFRVQGAGFDDDTSVAKLVGRVDPGGSGQEQSFTITDSVTVVGPTDDDDRDDDSDDDNPGRGNGNSEGRGRGTDDDDDEDEDRDDDDDDDDDDRDEDDD